MYSYIKANNKTLEYSQTIEYSILEIENLLFNTIKCI